MRKYDYGFTLSELLIVITIIGVLAALLLPYLLGARDRALDVAAAGGAKQIASGQAIMLIDTEAYSADLAALNTATSNLAGNCEADWVVDLAPFEDGWAVSHPNGSGLV